MAAARRPSKDGPQCRRSSAAACGPQRTAALCALQALHAPRSGCAHAASAIRFCCASSAPPHFLGRLSGPFHHETVAFHHQRDRMPPAAGAAAFDVEPAIRLVHLAERAGLGCEAHGIRRDDQRTGLGPAGAVLRIDGPAAELRLGGGCGTCESSKKNGGRTADFHVSPSASSLSRRMEHRNDVDPLVPHTMNNDVRKTGYRQHSFPSRRPDDQTKARHSSVRLNDQSSPPRASQRPDQIRQCNRESFRYRGAPVSCNERSFG